jgi:hypothetical protein
MCAQAGAQGVGPGASPGRASFRPQALWNDGPYFTVGHTNPYLPHPSIWTGLVTSDPDRPPYANWPRGHYSTFNPEQGALYPYEEGFSAYSGYADWYKEVNDFEPTPEDIERAKILFLRSGAPAVNVIPTPETPSTTVPPPPQPRVPPGPQARPGKIETPEKARQPLAPGRIPIYRGRAGGM